MIPKFRLRVKKRIVGYEKWYPGDLVEHRAEPCWLYSEDGLHWTPTYIYHTYKDQSVGFDDKNGKEIFEGDRVETEQGEATVKFGDGMFYLEFTDKSVCDCSSYEDDMTVISELLKEIK